MSTSADLADPYRARASLYAAETARVPAPRPLPGLLADGPHVGEIPCGTGHFLTAYQHAGCAVTLGDASTAMLDIARRAARAVGIPAGRTTATRVLLPDGPLPSWLDLLVSPNAALCQLSAHHSLAALATAHARMLRPGGHAVFQLACRHRDGTIDSTTFYDPTAPHDTWFDDHQFTQPGIGTITRRRRQHRDDDQLRIEFDYRAPTPPHPQATAVEVTLHAPADLADALAAAGFDDITTVPGRDRATDIIATRTAGPRHER